MIRASSDNHLFSVTLKAVAPSLTYKAAEIPTQPQYGHVVPKGIAHIKRIEGILAEPSSDLPALVREECFDLIEQISEKTARIDAKTAKARALSLATDTARRLQTMPGVGPQTALAISGFAPPMESFKRGRDFAAWLGLVPRQYASGGKERLGRVSKAGQTDIRSLLIIGAMSRLTVLARKSIVEGSWLGRMLHHKPLMLVAIALANKMARAIWAMMTKKKIIEIRRESWLHDGYAAPHELASVREV